MYVRELCSEFHLSAPRRDASRCCAARSWGSRGGPEVLRVTRVRGAASGSQVLASGDRRLHGQAWMHATPWRPARPAPIRAAPCHDACVQLSVSTSSSLKCSSNFLHGHSHPGRLASPRPVAPACGRPACPRRAPPRLHGLPAG